METFGGRIRGSFDKSWCVFKEFTHYKCIIEIGNIKVIRIGYSAIEAFDAAFDEMVRRSNGDALMAHYLVEFNDQMVAQRN